MDYILPHTTKVDGPPDNDILAQFVNLPEHNSGRPLTEYFGNYNSFLDLDKEYERIVLTSDDFKLSYRPNVYRFILGTWSSFKRDIRIDPQFWKHIRKIELEIGGDATETVYGEIAKVQHKLFGIDNPDTVPFSCINDTKYIPPTVWHEVVIRIEFNEPKLPDGFSMSYEKAPFCGVNRHGLGVNQDYFPYPTAWIISQTREWQDHPMITHIIVDSLDFTLWSEQYSGSDTSKVVTEVDVQKEKLEKIDGWYVIRLVESTEPADIAKMKILYLKMDVGEGVTFYGVRLNILMSMSGMAGKRFGP